MESSSSTLLNENTLRLEGPKVMQQAMYTFQAGSAAAPLCGVPKTTQQPATTNPPPSQPITFPQQFLAAIPTQPTTTVQQQIQWQQALQTLAQAQTGAGFGGLAAHSGVDANQAAAAAAAPFLASLTIPHLLQFNTLQQQQQQQQQVAAVVGAGQIPIQPAMPPPPTASSLTTSNTNESRNNKRCNSRMADGNSNLNSSSERNEPRKPPKRALNSKKLPKSGASIVISLSGGSHSTSAAFPTRQQSDHIDGMDNFQPPQEKSAAAIEKMTATERRRYERNLREQQRSYRISQQIKELRDVLQESNVPFRPNKYSILVSVAEYIQQLQARAIMLDSEHQRLIDTIRNTTDATSSGRSSGTLFEVSKGSSSTQSMDGDGPEDEVNSNVVPNSAYSDASVYPDSLLVPGIDYEAVFFNCPYPVGVATLDGRIIAANNEFEMLLNPNYNNTPMMDQSFFVFIRNHQEMFEAMAALLKQSTASIDRGEGTITKSPNLLFWHGQVVSSRNEIVRVFPHCHFSSPFANFISFAYAVANSIHLQLH
jgi:Helix-loop-helix DNA-binding domain